MAIEGKMKVSNDVVGGGIEILNRPPYEGVPVTLNSTVFADKEVIKAGSLITDKGLVASAAEGAAGVLLFDVYKDAPQGTILKKAYVNVKRIKESLGGDFTTQYGEDVSTAQEKLPMIVFEEISGE